ncbi:MAG: CPBP family intramembrane metalloprotease [Caulobacterales bacterium]|nr:CPBP family intramembrane metalloprotease [Caulobacterales bacterium]
MRSPQRPLLYLALLLAVALPIWLLSGRLGVIAGLRIPASDLALAFTPMVVALGLSLRDGGWRGGLGLLARAVDVRRLGFGRGAAWTLLIPVGIYAASSLVTPWLGFGRGQAEPDPLRLLGLLPLFLLLAAGEEIGWTGYALQPLQQRWGPLAAACVLAVPWWAGHLPSMAEIGATPADMAWWALGALAIRVIMCWLYNATGMSTFAVILFHALLNLSRIATVPAVGAHYVTAYQACADLLFAGLAVALLIRTRGRLAEASAIH